MKTTTMVIWISSALLVASLAAAVWFFYDPPHPGVRVVFGGGQPAVRAEVAASPVALMRGLSGHAPLGPDQGMLFLFSSAGQFPFWMKGMLFPIDVIWIRGGKIVDITAEVPVPTGHGALPTFSPKEAADSVLEVNAGYARAHGLAVGLTAIAYGIDGKTLVR